jgi:hypothetical protein
MVVGQPGGGGGAKSEEKSRVRGKYGSESEEDRAEWLPGVEMGLSG